MLTTILGFIAILGTLIFFHELGHYLVARRNGIEVEEFGVFGFPPRLFKLFTYDGTDFTINLIPLGAFVRMKGEDSDDLSPGSFNAASAGARAMVLLAGPGMNAILAVLLFAASFLAGFPASAGSPMLTDVPQGSPAAQLGLQAGDILLYLGETPVLVSAEPDLTFQVKKLPENDKPLAVPAPNALLVGRGEAVVPIALPEGLTLDELLADVSYRPVLTTRITGVAEGSPAQQVGLQPGDRIHSVNGELVTPENPVTRLVNRYRGQEIQLTVLRSGEWITVQVTPRVNPPEGQGALGIAIGPVSVLGVLPLHQALWQGLVTTFEYVRLVLMLPVLIFTGRIAASEAGLAGPVGIAQLVGGAVSATIETGYWYPIWRLSAIISAGLAIANLMPLPALDGGRLVFILIEKLRGRRIDPQKEGVVHLIGFMLLLGMMVLVTVSDLSSAPQQIDWHLLLGK